MTAKPSGSKVPRHKLNAIRFQVTGCFEQKATKATTNVRR